MAARRKESGVPDGKAKAGRYELTYLMNVRKRPALQAEPVGTLRPGTVVTVTGIREDWMCLENGTFVFYGGGKYAKRAE